MSGFFETPLPYPPHSSVVGRGNNPHAWWWYQESGCAQPTAEERNNPLIKSFGPAAFRLKVGSIAHYVCRMATDYNPACRSLFSGLWAANDFPNPPAGRLIHDGWFAGGLVVADVFEKKAGFAGAVDCSSPGAPGEICAVHVVSGLSSGPIRIVASFLPSHDDAGCF